MTLKVGDIVRLKSCGPNMRVGGALGEVIRAVWFVNKTVFEESFHQGKLVKVR